MARRWRLRNKLVFGLVLVLGSLGLLLAASVQGLTTYSHSMKMFESKLAELQKIDELRPAVQNLLPRDGEKREWDPAAYTKQIEAIAATFAQLRSVFQVAVQKDRESDPYTKAKLLSDFREKLEAFQGGLEDHFSRPRVTGDEGIFNVEKDPVLKEAYAGLVSIADSLRASCMADMGQRTMESRSWYRRSLWVIGIASIVAIVLLVALVTLCTQWLVKPINELQAGVERVSRKDFKQSIELKSGDELEDLAEAFNAMSRHIDETYRNLEQQIDERSRQLVKSERMVSVGFLAAGVSHEINNPLASIAFCAEALQSRLADYMREHPADTEVIEKYLRMIQQEAFRCKEITSRLLEFSRVGERRREPTDMAELVQNVLEIAQHLKNCRGKRIVFQPYARVTAQVNAQDVKSVVLNLVVNALDSMDEGGVLDIELKAEGGVAELRFADTGCGMKPETLKHIFEPFYTRSKTGKGTGLGLFISHQIVDQHGGEISADSAGIGQGSSFRVRLPLKAVKVDAPAGTESMDADLYMLGTKRKAAGNTWMEDGLGNAAA